MFSAAPMMRLNVIVLQHDERTVLRGLGELGAVQLVRTPAGPETAPLDPPDSSSERARCVALRFRITELRRRLELPPPAPLSPDIKILTLSEIEEGLQDLEQRADKLLGKCDVLQKQWGQVAALVEQMQVYRNVDIPFDELGDSNFLHFALGRLPNENMDALR